MLRSILAVIVGYFVIVLCVFLSFSALYLLLGPDKAFRPESYDVSILWLAVTFPLALLAAVVGGFVCAKISRGGKAPVVLAVLVFVLGMLSAIPVLTAEPSTAVRTAEVGNLEAMAGAQQPAWVALLNPIIGAAGTLFGAKLAGPRVGASRLDPTAT
jgi:hypothetical protein